MGKHETNNGINTGIDSIGPGSFNEFSAKNPDIPPSRLVNEYSEALFLGRLARARALSVDLEDLHRFKFDREN